MECASYPRLIILLWKQLTNDLILDQERPRAGGERDDRGWDSWMASLTQWTWVWVNSESWWWTGGPGVLRPMGLQRAGHNWVTELNWTEAFLVGQYCEFLQLLYCLIKRLCSCSQNTTCWVPLKCQSPWVNGRLSSQVKSHYRDLQGDSIFSYNTQMLL